MSNWYITGLDSISCKVYYSLDQHKNKDNLVALNNDRIIEYAEEQEMSAVSYHIGLGGCISNGNIEVYETGSYYIIYKVL